MRSCVCLVLAAGLVAAQESSRTIYEFDANGRRVPAGRLDSAKAGGDTSQQKSTPGLNGRAEALETTEEKVISEDADSRIVEKIYTRFDGAGHRNGVEKVRIEERKNPDGTTTTTEAVYDSSLSGRFDLRERSVTQTAKDGSTTRAETVTERPTVNGSLETVERRVSVTTGDDNDSRRDLTVYRRDQQNRFSEAIREITQTRKEGGETVSEVAEYNTAATGSMQLAGQKVSRKSTAADGSETEVIDVFGTSNPGLMSGGATGPRLRERQVYQRVPGDDAKTVETFSVQRVNLDSDKLGPAMKVRETVCSGACK